MTDRPAKPVTSQNSATGTGVSRRHVLGGMGGALIAGVGGELVASGSAKAAAPELRTHRDGGQTQPKDQRKFGYAIVGLGNYALHQILPAFAECRYARLTALVSGDPAKARRIGAEYGIGPGHIYSYENFDSIARDPEVDAVYILLPTALHSAMTVRAFKAGKHVLCETPMATSVGDCQLMLAASKRARKYLMLGYRCHFDPLTLKAVAMLNGGAVGARQVVTTDNSDINVPLSEVAHSWRFDRSLSGGGSLINLGLYGVNGTRYLLDEDPVQVQACILPNKNPLFSSVEDTVAWTLLYKSGAVAHGSSSYTIKDASTFRVLGDKGGLLMDPATSYWANRVSLISGDATQSWGTPQFTLPALNQFSAELDYLAECVARQQPPVRASGQEGLQDMRLITAMYESAHTGQPVNTSQWADWRKSL
ncbi:Gfo/Idh/MocA family protein [Oecophyllibacter saccharovorans]|uniref:Gfo/Idh/MocA family oxidoreductase n=1 Tax=Oecophyllibacter saccharovorans TaxID=2558360 RepID=A0A506UQI9_9PROT|nr:Gfo/Idh/MocA family oxidoreductase [Oecophyllibacter saccharovorans]TPW35600.1 Gfo/Idh/MocA family oxidoreductase [Oecophyllibacter saccharovorans]